jgi:hypothetical protein
MIFRKVYEYFITEEMRRDVVANTRAKIFIGSALFSTLVFFANAYRGFATGDAVQGIAIVVGTMLLMSTFWILKISRSTLFAGNIFIAVFYVALFLLILRSAGPNSMIHIFFAVLIILSFLICGFRSGIVWGVLIMFELLASKALAISGYEFVPLRVEAVFISVFIRKGSCKFSSSCVATSFSVFFSRAASLVRSD